jgi:hypothetical protein
VTEGSVPLPGLALTPDPVGRWRPLSEQRLIVLVGVTGVGKSTALTALLSSPVGLKLLPDRREVTDAVMIAPLAGGPVTDREQRFALTARYREQHPGGMAQALGSLSADPQRWNGGLIFDGLRGADEVGYAAQHCPQWRFVSLHAPDALRVRRLLGRADAFDTVGKKTGEMTDLRGALAELKGAEQVFTSAELDALAALAASGYTPSDVIAKTRIVLSERQHYDPQAARAVLKMLPAAHSLDLDTNLLSPEVVARQITAWMKL